MTWAKLKAMAKILKHVDSIISSVVVGLTVIAAVSISGSKE